MGRKKKKEQVMPTWWQEALRFHRWYVIGSGVTVLWYPAWGGCIFCGHVPRGLLPEPVTVLDVIDEVCAWQLRNGRQLTLLGLRWWPQQRGFSDNWHLPSSSG